MPDSSSNSIDALRNIAGHDDAMRPKPTDVVPIWHNIPVDQLKVFRDAVAQLRIYGLTLDLRNGLMIDGGSSGQWEYIVPIV